MFFLICEYDFTYNIRRSTIDVHHKRDILSVSWIKIGY